MPNVDRVYNVDHRFEAFQNHQAGLLVCLAGPGTGKTYSLLRRIRQLTLNGATSPDSICYLTFIKEIARAFLGDYHEEFGADPHANSLPRITTLHSFACRLIRNRGFSLGYDGPLYFATLSDAAEPSAGVFLQDLIPLVAHLGPNTIPQLRACVDRIKHAWRNNEDPRQLGSPEADVHDRCLALARVYRLFDWDQAVPTAHSLFQDPRNRQRWITDLQHYLIDEYQDFNPAEHAFMSSLQSTVASMVIVGDDNQSIFRGRGASPHMLADLFSSHAADQVSLPRCRRCRSSILTAANHFLASFRPESQPLLPLHDGGEIACHCFRSNRAEVAFLSEYLQALLDEVPDHALPTDAITCLFPNKKSLRFYYDSLSQHLPCYTQKAEPDPARVSLGLHLQLVCNPLQRFAQRLLLEHFEAIKPRHKHSMVTHMLASDLSPSAALERMIQSGELTSNAAAAARSFTTLCEELSSGNENRVAEALASRVHVGHDLLLECTSDLMHQLGEQDQDDVVSAFCDRVLPASAQPPDDPRAIQFTTIHGSKGLTRHAILMPGLEDAWLPGQLQGEDFEESRRLFYVAMTRASDHVLITYPRTRARGDPLNYRVRGRGRPCRFVNDAGIPHFLHV